MKNCLYCEKVCGSYESYREHVTRKH